jgi:hypothetical protein
LEKITAFSGHFARVRQGGTREVSFTGRGKRAGNREKNRRSLEKIQKMGFLTGRKSFIIRI